MQQFGLIEIGAIAGALLTLVSLSGWIVKTVNKQILRAASPIHGDLTEAIRQNRAAATMSLKYSLIHAHEEYMQKGKIGRYALQCIHEMHDQYKALCNDGFIAALVRQLHELPIDMTVGNSAASGQDK